MGIDDTLAFTKNKIFYTEPGEKEKSVGTEDFAKVRTKLHKDTKYNFREFRQFETVYSGITRGEPNIKVLKQVDKAIKAGHKIGVLTARGNQAAVYNAINNWLLYRNEKGELEKIPKSVFNKKYAFAVSDDKVIKAYGGEGSAAEPQALKAFVLKNILADKMGFKHVIFFDDDVSNVAAVKELKDPRITAILV